MASPRILLVDDDDRMREVVREILADDGMEVIEARDGTEAIRLFRSQATDLVICDLFMPGKDGLETIRDLRKEFGAVKVIALSGGGYQGALDMLQVARHMGAAEVLSKPFKLKELQALVRRLLAPAS